MSIENREKQMIKNFKTIVQFVFVFPQFWLIWKIASYTTAWLKKEIVAKYVASYHTFIIHAEETICLLVTGVFNSINRGF